MKNIEKYQQRLHFELRQENTSLFLQKAATKENLLLHASKMLRTSQKQFPPTRIGDTVRIRVPDVDLGRTDS